MNKTLLKFSIIFLISISSFSQSFMKYTVDSSTAEEPYSIASGHLNDDAFLDVAISSDTGSTVEWYKNNGDGTFTDMGALIAIAPADLSFAEGIEIADINNDGDNDILATSYVNDNLVWFENNGDETFQNAVEISDAINGAGTIKIVNLDNDSNGYLDVVVTAYEDNSVIYMLGNGDGTFGAIRYLAPVTAGSGPGNIDLADFDNDGDLDAVIAFTGNGNVAIYENRLIPDGLDGSGNVPFEPYDNLVDSGNGFLWTVSFADIDDDNDLDIVKSDYLGSGGSNIVWYSFDNDDGFGNPVSTTTWSNHPIATSISRTAMASVADFNNDMNNDLLVTNGRATDNDVIWFESDDMGALGTEIFIDDSSPSFFDVEIQDFDNDGDLDIAGISYLSDDVFVFFSDYVLGTEENLIESIGIYPNPTKDILYFKIPNNENFKISVYNVLGKKIISRTLKYNDVLNVSNFSNGVYVLRFEDYDKTFKFVKK